MIVSNFSPFFFVLISNNFFWQFWGSGVGIFCSCSSTYFPPLKNFLHFFFVIYPFSFLYGFFFPLFFPRYRTSCFFLLLLILFLFSMGVFVVVMLLQVSSACQGRV